MLRARRIKGRTLLAADSRFRGRQRKIMDQTDPSDDGRLVVETSEGRFEVGPLLRRGATGVVHRGRWKEAPARPWVDAVLKLECVDAQKRQMAREVDVYRLLDAAPVPPSRGASFARHIGNLSETVDIGAGPSRLLCMQALGPNLDEVVKERGPLSKQATLAVARRLVDALQFLHEHSKHAHRDIKPQNICVSSKANDATLYLIDFGLAAPLFTERGAHQPLEDLAPKAASNARRRVVGSVRYLSIHAHRAVEKYGRARRAATARRCDLEAVAYVAMYLHEGPLPWSDLPAKTGHEPDVAIHRAKVRLPPLQLVGPSLSSTVGAFLEATRALDHSAAPDYGALKRLLTDQSEPPDVGSAWAPRPSLREVEALESRVERGLREALAVVASPARAERTVSPPRVKSPPLTPLLAPPPARSIGPRPSLPDFPAQSPLPEALQRAEDFMPPTPILDTPRGKESPHAYDSTKKAPRSALKRPSLNSTGSAKRVRLSDSVETWELDDLGYASPHAQTTNVVAGLNAADCEAVLQRWRGRLLPSPPASAPPGSPASPQRTTSTTLQRLLPHLSNEKKLVKAARVLTEVLKRAPLEVTGRTAADRARCQALRSADSGALRDALALSLHGGQAAVVHAKHLRPTYAALFEAALERCVPGHLPDTVQAEVALWALVVPYNSCLDDAESTTLSADLKIGQLAGSMRVLRRCLFLLEKRGRPRKDDDARRIDAPAALEPPDAVFATRGLDVLLALAATVRDPESPRESIVALLQSAKTALAHYLSPAQRRKLDTTASTIRATRAGS